MTRKSRIFGLILAFLPPLLVGAADASSPPEPASIICPDAPADAELFAAREIRRFFYLRTGRLLPVEQRDNALVPAQSAIVVADKSSKLCQSLAQDLHLTLPVLTNETYWLKTGVSGSNRLALVVGGDPVGTLYGAYRLGEILGMRFYLDQEVIPDERLPLQIPTLDEMARPLFRLRGILPFHDFPEGPDWWERDDYLAILADLPKLRMNFFGLHTYSQTVPNGELLTGAEPTVWIGPASDIGEAGRVKSGYEAGYENTADAYWGYLPKKTSDFSCGAAALFDKDDYGADLSDGAPNNDSNYIFRESGALLRDSFVFAHKLGIKTCVGTETPLPLPKEVTQRLLAQGRDPWVPSSTEGLYEGMFERITRTYPVDYYWLWTPEPWTWRKIMPEEVSASVDDLITAVGAWKKVKPPFALATAGWAMGPPTDRTLFDRLLSKDISMSCINQQVGATPVDPGFAKIKGRSKWEISWLEDDKALTAPQLWAGRTRRDAFDALRYGCDGLMGIHWRTRELAPAISALAQAAWSQAGWSAAWNGDLASASNFPPVNDFYADWARHEFGDEAGEAAGAIFAKLDGHLPRPADWVRGPGCPKPETNSWEDVAKEYTFVDEFAKLAPKVKGAANRERFDWWLNSLQYMRGMAQVSCTWYQASTAVSMAMDATSVSEASRIARESALPLHRQLVGQLTEVYKLLLATVSNPGELGTVANWEQHVFPIILERPGLALENLLGEKLPASLKMPRTYDGPTRLIVPTVRTSFARGENLSLKVLVLSAQPPGDLKLHWRTMGQGAYAEVPAQLVARGVYRVAFPAGATTGVGLEYYLTEGGGDQPPVIWPVTAPAVGQTLAAMEK